MSKAKPSEGYVLVAVLTVMLVLAGLIAASSLVAQSALRGARTDVAVDRLDALLRGGLEVTAFRLFTQKMTPTAVNGRNLGFDRGIVTAQITDEAGRIDVNGADPALLAGALRSVGIDAQTASAVAARVAARRGKADAAPGAPATGTSPPVSSQSPGVPDSQGAGTAPVTPPDGKTVSGRTGFRSVAEFLDFAELDRDDRAALADLLTVMNPDGKVNVLGASRRALMALPEISEATADAVMAERRSALRSGPGNLKSLLDKQKRFIKFEAGPCFLVRLVSRDPLGRSAAREAVIAPGNDQTDPFYILQWR